MLAWFAFNFIARGVLYYSRRVAEDYLYWLNRFSQSSHYEWGGGGA